MNRTIISTAVAGVCACLAGGASALALNTYVAGSDTLEVRISGASAQDIALEKMLAAICDSGTLNGAQQLNNSVYYCSISPTTTVDGITIFQGVPLSVNKLVVYKGSIGGSGNGVAPVANSQTNMVFLNLATLAANSSYLGAAVTITSSVLPTYTMQQIAATATSLSTSTGIPDIGLSDVEPSLLSASAAVIANLDRFEGAHLTFGIPVTLTMRDALQTAQSLTAGSDAAADQPSLSTQQLAAVMNGSSTNLSTLGLPSGGVNIAFRSAGSGTTRVNNAYFGTDGSQCNLGARGRRASNASLGDTTGSSCSIVPGSTGTVMWGGGTDNVMACLVNHQAGSRSAFGVASMETSTGPGTALPGLRYIKIDGDLPTLVNVANGRYGLWASVSYQYRNATSGNALTGDKLSAATTFRSALSNKNVLLDVNATILQPWASAGDVGYLAAPSATNTPPGLPIANQAALNVNPTNPFTKVNSLVQNNCLTGVRF